MGVFCGQSAGFGQFVHKEGVFCGLCGFEPFRPQKEGFGGRSTDLNTSETNGLGSRDVITGGLQKG